MIERLHRIFGPERPLLVVLAVAVAVRLLYLSEYHSLPDWSQLTVDNYYHHHWALSIAGGNIFGETTYFRAPFYVFCLAFLYALFGASLWIGRLFGLGIGLASIILTYLLAKRIFDRKVAVVAALFHALCPMMIYYESELLLDPLFMLLMQLAVYRVIIWKEWQSPTNAFLIGLFVGVAAITRPTILLFVPILIVLFAVYSRQGAVTARNAVMFLLGTFLFIAPIFARNVIVGGEPVLIAAQGGINFYIGNNAQSDGLSAVVPEPLGHNWSLKDVAYLASKETGHRLTPGELSSYWTRKAMAWIISQPGAFSQLYLRKLYHCFANQEISNDRDLPYFFHQIPILMYNPLSFGILFALAFAGVLLTWRRSVAVRLIVIVILVYSGAIALFFFNSRFRLPILPYVILLSAAGTIGLWRSLVARRKSAARVAGAAVLAGLFSFAPIFHSHPGYRPLPLMSRGLHLYANEEYPKAAMYFRSVLAMDSTFPDANLTLGACFLRLGQTDSAANCFEREKRFNPLRPKAYANAASIRLLEGRYDEAMAEAQMSLERQLYDVTANRIYLRAAAAMATVSNDSLVQLIHYSTANTEGDIFLLNDAAALLVQRGALSAAENILLLALHTERPAIETDDEAFSSFFKNSPDNWARESSKAKFQLGYICGLQGRYMEAVHYSSLAIQGDSGLAQAYVNLVSGYLSLGQFERADTTLAVARARFPSDSLLSRLDNLIGEWQKEGNRRPPIP
ncbi:MAG TPA: glycosyltransferase family 39 protein [Candidatus Deferrimicrobium sp.]|nr:glycosyltransferase family 39 protein [Candidatus Deferrimicrobium sp.]